MGRSEAPTLWDRSRQAAIESILETALRLFAEEGYEATTTARIAREAGISQRSLFRYFGSKEDLVCGEQDARGVLLKETVAAQPDDVSVWEALRTGLIAATVPDHPPERALEISRLIHSTPSLRARQTEKRLRWQELLAPEVERRMGLDGGPVPRAGALAVIGTVFACMDAAVDAWVASGGTADALALYDEAVAAVRGQD
ncbi:TetR family transcriptional regulator [Streptomyces carminius]|uniref:TetR family transcriptional regulator n=1 Tax=Streptomyces carminius TaxID=2665496 RepID=A0A2M8LQK1_9ACTN|nr:TetR/AcrR family transcriptional regulator [Streptomyces carminius]PJE94210.1 TetR family transcriptional regulator [Streptomyces carminius]